MPALNGELGGGRRHAGAWADTKSGSSLSGRLAGDSEARGKMGDGFMLVIRQVQLDALGKSLRSGFEAQLVRHFVNLYPRESKEAGGESQIAKLVSRGVRRAAERGYTNRKEVGLFVALMFILGDAFDADPQLPWAARQLEDRNIPLALRPECVFDYAIDYLGETAGENCGYLVRAMLRLRSYDLASAPDSSGDLWVDDCCELLEGYYPQKFDYQGDAANRALISLGRRNAARHGFYSSRSVTLFVILMFMLGSGFDGDLLYPWAGNALSGPSGEDERTEGLFRSALAHLEYSLSSD